MKGSEHLTHTYTAHAPHKPHAPHTSPDEDETRATCVLRTMHAPWSLAQHWLRAATLQPILSEFYCRKAPWHKGPQYPCQMRVIKSQFRNEKNKVSSSALHASFLCMLELSAPADAPAFAANRRPRNARRKPAPHPCKQHTRITISP